MPQTWLDNGGLYQKYGVDQTTSGTGGEYRTNGAMREIEFYLNLVTLTETETVVDDNIFFPAGVKIQEVEIYVETAAATGTGIDIGLVRTDRTTEIDFDGIVAASLTGTLTAGAKLLLVKGSTSVGAYITNGTSTPNVGHITASRTSATAFTAGLIKVRVRYERP